MIWLLWRQHRLAALAMALLLAAVAAPLIATGLPMYDSFNADGVGACVGQTTVRCADILNLFSDQYRGAGTQLIPWLNFVPGLLGVFVGAPWIAREIEQGTHRLVWTQGTSRRRWLAVKVLGLLALTVAAAVVFTALMTWWRWPLDQLEGRFADQVFSFEGPVVATYAIFAFALGTAAGVFLRRTVPALVVALAGYPLVRLPVEYGLRPRFMAPMTVTLDATSDKSAEILDGSGNWYVDAGFVDQSGHHLTQTQIDAAFRESLSAGVAPPTYFHEHGIMRWLEYQPADRLAAFQTIESAIFIVLSVILLAVALALVRRRVS